VTPVPPGERLILLIRPHPVYVLLRSLWALAALVAAAAGTAWTVRRFQLRMDVRPIIAGLTIVGVVKVLWEAAQWLSRSYELTDRRAVRRAGVVRRYHADLPLSRLQHLTLTRTLGERLTGVGTIGFATAGTGVMEMFWVMVARPHEVLGTVREAMVRAQDSSGPKPDGVPVIGLAGGVGAGKSEVARILASLGCMVIDSDQEAREVMQRPEVRDELVRWWGPGILGADGGVNRSAVAEIVFKDPEQRRRLEGMVHPLVRSRRAEMRRGAGRARAVVIDAPLLFEAGVDVECDAVLFIDAPRDRRLSRVAASRGWDEAELTRREAAQMSLDEKRRRSTAVVVNDGSVEVLRGRVSAALEDVLGRVRGSVVRGGGPRAGVLDSGVP
jgi:dephospho-CoA kinase